MPLYNAGNDIVRAFLEGHAEGRATIAQKQKVEQEKLDREARQKEHEDALKQANDHFNAEMTLRKALQDVSLVRQRAGIAKDIATTGINPGLPETQSVVESPQQSSEMLGRNFSSGGIDPMTLMPRQAQAVGNESPTIMRKLTLPDQSELSVPDAFSYARDTANRQRELLKPQTEQKVEVAKKIAEVTQPFQMALKQQEEEARAQLENIKFKGRQNELAQKAIQDEKNIRLRANLRPSPANREAGSILSPGDLEKLNSTRGDNPLPYGITKGEAAKLGVVPGRVMNATEEAKLNGLLALRKEFTDLYNLGTAGGYQSEHTPFAGATLGTIKNKLNMGTEEQTQYRTLANKMTAKQILDFYGKVVPKTEKDLSASWVSSLSEAGNTAKIKNKRAIDDLTNEIGLILKGTGKADNAPAINSGGSGKTMTLHYSDGSSEKVPDTPENRKKYGNPGAIQ